MEEERVKEDALRIIGLFEVLPRMVVFDLDYTLWPFYCEMRSKREMPSLYPQAKGILHALKNKGIELAIASRSPTPEIANKFIDKLGIQSIFVTKEIFSSWTYKKEHFQRIHRTTGVPFESMLFYDDEYGNIHTNDVTIFPCSSLMIPPPQLVQGPLSSNHLHLISRPPDQVSKMGVTSILVDDGVNLRELRTGLEKFSENCKQPDMNK